VYSITSAILNPAIPPFIRFRMACIVITMPGPRMPSHSDSRPPVSPSPIPNPSFHASHTHTVHTCRRVASTHTIARRPARTTATLVCVSSHAVPHASACLRVHAHRRCFVPPLPFCPSHVGCPCLCRLVRLGRVLARPLGRSRGLARRCLCRWRRAEGFAHRAIVAWRASASACRLAKSENITPSTVG
jgi:hypothetical protein